MNILHPRSDKDDQNNNAHPLILLLENFSEAFYLDKYELEELERWNNKTKTKNNENYPRVRLLKEIDLEKPSYQSTPNTVFVFYPLEQTR